MRSKAFRAFCSVVYICVSVAVQSSYGQSVRRNFHSLSTAQLQSFRHGIEVMKSRPISDPTSWAFQAAMHGTPDVPSHELFNSCEHGSLYFLTWHRGFLYYFERILRSSSGDPNLTLPYWDWTNDRAVPPAFRQPNNNTNALFHVRAINNGALLPTQVVVLDKNSASQAPSFSLFSDLMEGSPHGAIHVLVGGDMGFVPRAARDPIFWMHHSNIDRLWNEWLNQTGHSNPVDNQYLNRQFEFVDENGDIVTVTARDIINSSILGYEYDDVPNPNPQEALDHTVPILAGTSHGNSHHSSHTNSTIAQTETSPPNNGHDHVDAGIVVASSRKASSTEAASVPDERENLTFGRKSISLAFVEDKESLLSAAVERTEGKASQQVVLEIHDLNVDKPPTFTFGIYINLPPNETNEERMQQYYVTSLNFFGLSKEDQKAHGHHSSHILRINLSEAIDRLKRLEAWDGKKINVTFVPVTATPPLGETESVESLQAVAESANISFDHIELKVLGSAESTDAGSQESTLQSMHAPIQRRVALPLPPAKREIVTENMEMFSAMAVDSPTDLSVLTLNNMMNARSKLAHEIDLLDAEITRFQTESICLGSADFQDVESYNGQAGVSVDFVKKFERSIGQLQWISDLMDRFSNPGESPGNVNNVRWGSGGLIADDLFLTAGHCLDRDAGGWEMPQRNGVTISSDEIATLMKVNFGYQVDPATGQPRRAKSFPVTELVEYRLGGLDYAILRLGRNSDGKLPGQVFGILTIAAQDVQSPGTMLCLIQHPNGMPKKIHAGPLRDNLFGKITYATLDSLGGSSGSPILDPNGLVVGVHTNGGCDQAQGFNFGVAIGTIKQASVELP